MYHSTTLLSVVAYIATVHAGGRKSCPASVTSENPSTVCPLLGPQRPAPTALAEDPIFQAAAANLTAQLDSLSRHAKGFNDSSFSITMFSTSDPDLIYQYHRTDPGVAQSSVGVNTVTASSVYRIGSVSKLLTVYMFLLQVGEQHLYDPVSRYIPELLDQVNITSEDLDVIPFDWTQITLLELASYTAGIFDDIAKDLVDPGYGPVSGQIPGFPTVPRNQTRSCGFATSDYVTTGYEPCNNKPQYLDLARRWQPIFPNSYTPVYTNEGFDLLGLAMTNAANTSLEKVFDTQLIRRLNLTGASAFLPSSPCNGVIPINETSAQWSYALGYQAPSGGYYASSEDMAKIGRSILNSTLLSNSATRRWLKPTSFVENFAQGVGLAWEIYRFKVANHSVNIYSKGGDIGVYHSWFAVIPDYDIGFSVLTATTALEHVLLFAQINGSALVLETMLPAIAQVAKDQAVRNLAGTYTLGTGNTSLTVAADSEPGFKLEAWISDSTDIMATVFNDSEIRLMPNQLYTGRKVGFTGVAVQVGAGVDPVSDGSLSQPWWMRCGAWWQGAGLFQYDGVDVLQFVFNTDTDGKAVSVRSKALRVTMNKQA